MQLTEQQVEFIYREVSRCSQMPTSLQDDLVEHLCCATEARIEEGYSFKEAYATALEQTCPNGLDEIHRENTSLLTTHNLKTMKKAIAIIGLIASMSFIWGVTSKVMHWPAANVFMHGGSLLFALLFAPLWVIDRFKSNSLVLSEKARLIAGILAGISFTVGATFKLMHWPNANMLMTAGSLLFAFVFLPIFFFQMYKKQVSY